MRLCSLMNSTERTSLHAPLSASGSFVTAEIADGPASVPP
jgi:hypothetical protein